MNCFSACTHAIARCLLSGVFLVIAGCGVPASESAGRSDSGEYAVHYLIAPVPGTSTVSVSMRVRQPAALLRELSFPVGGMVENIDGDGDVRVAGERVTWLPPDGGGTLSWQVNIGHRRGDSGYDAYLAEWGLFRMEDIIPRARTRTRKDAVSRTSFEFDLPKQWSVITEYSSLERPVIVDRPERRFDQPTGWVAIGDLGVRRDTIAGTRVAVAAPEGHDVRRLEMLAVLNWTLPELNAILPRALPRLTIISAGDPMWRGGLSAPASLFLHAARPLISENATSPLLHEVMHTALRLRPPDGYDWIAEGLAEYYSIELLRRGRAITRKRAAAAFERQAEWARDSDTLCASVSTAATTARAVTLFAALDRELSQSSEGESGLDDLVAALVGTRPDLASLTAAAAGLIGATPDVLHIDNLPGCRSIAPNEAKD